LSKGSKCGFAGTESILGHLKAVDSQVYRSALAAAMPQPFDIPLNCPTCGQPMSVRIQLPRHFLPRQAPSKREIRCPREDCNGHIDPTIHGEVVAVWPGHGPGPQPRTD
jgi:hypothetical protein